MAAATVRRTRYEELRTATSRKQRDAGREGLRTGNEDSRVRPEGQSFDRHYRHRAYDPLPARPVL